MLADEFNGIFEKSIKNMHNNKMVSIGVLFLLLLFLPPDQTFIMNFKNTQKRSDGSICAHILTTLIK